MRVIRILSAVVLITSMVAAPGLGADRDAQRAAFREVIALEKEAADNLPLDFEAAKTQLEEAATKLDNMDVRGDLKELASEAAGLDRFAINQIDGMTADGEVTEDEMEFLFWLLRKALAMKTEAIDVIRFFENLDKMLDKKGRPSTSVDPPRCGTQDQGVGARSSCFTVDTWRIFIDRGARAAICKFVDPDGRRLSNLRPLFEDVIQETTCRLTDKTVVVNGVTKKVVRATLKLTTLDRYNPRGSASVRVVAFWR